ncbi:MAG TPA: class I SAM-dependent methyltransferase [Chloroflexia bacterium]|jgi:SAM-dependent methyltransferase
MHGDEARRDRLLARYYDLEYRDYRDDLDFYVQLAEWSNPARDGAVLELGCGTGRVALALAEAGFTVTAVDTSPGMLEVCERHAESRGVRERVVPVRLDMRELYRLPSERYSLVLCALNTFSYLPSTTDQLRVLQGVRPLLGSDSLLVLDLTPPWPEYLVPRDGEVLHQGSFRDEATGSVLHKFVTGTLDHAAQVHHVTMLYDLELADGSLTRLSEAAIFRWTGRFEMELLLGQAGFTVEHLYGDYELGDFGEGSARMIFVARPPGD